VQYLPYDVEYFWLTPALLSWQPPAIPAEHLPVPQPPTGVDGAMSPHHAGEANATIQVLRLPFAKLCSA